MVFKRPFPFVCLLLLLFLALGLIPACGGGASSAISGGSGGGGGNSGGGGGGGPISATTHFVFTASGGAVRGYRIDPSTGLASFASEVGITVDQGSPLYLATDPAGKFLFVSLFEQTDRSTTGKNQLLVYTIDHGTGNLTPMGSPVPGLAYSPVVSPDGKFLYTGGTLTTAPGGLIVNVYSIGQDGSLTPISGSPFATGLDINQGSRPMFLALNGTGTGLFIAFFQQVAAFQVDPNSGAPTPAPGSPFATPVTFLASIAIDPAGKFLYAGSQSLPSPNLLGFTVNSDKSISPIPGSPFDGGPTESSIAIVPSGKFLYDATAPASIGREVRGFSVDRTTGALATVSGSPFSTNQDWVFPITIDASGRFLYAAGSNGLETFQIDSNTGSLTQLDIASPGSSLETAAVVVNF